MMLAYVFPVASMAATVAGHSLVLALATSAQLSAADTRPPTAREQALVERACTARQAPGAAAHATLEQCFAARLLSLRADFGRDLSRLSTSARGKLDEACSGVDPARGRDAYVDCLGTHLASLSAVRARAQLPATIAAPLPATSRAALPATTGATPPAAAETPSVEASSTPAPQADSLPSVRAVTIFSSVGAVLAAVLLVMRARRARPVCRVCCVRLRESGDLCPACRLEAAEVLRRTAAARAERRRAHDAEQRRQQELADVQRREELRQEEEARLRLEETLRVKEESRRREERRQEVAQREEEDRQRLEAAAACDADDPAFDPYRALGLMPYAGSDEVRAAYEEARVKYDPEEVAHLSPDVQAHFAAKARASERVYRTLARESDETTSETSSEVHPSV